MSIFIDPNATFQISLKVKNIVNESGIITGVKIVDDNEEGEDIINIVCDCKYKDWETMSSILEESTIINHITGKPMIRVKTFVEQVINKFFVSWNQPYPINSLIHYNVKKKLVEKWHEATG